MRGEVHDGVGSRQNLCQSRRIQHIALHEFESRGQALESVIEIVEDDDFMPGAFECTCGMTTDVARTANDQNDHRLNSFLTQRLTSRRSNPQLYGCAGETSHQPKVPDGRSTTSCGLGMHPRNQPKAAPNLLYKLVTMT